MAVSLYVSVDALDAEVARCEAAVEALRARGAGDSEEALELIPRTFELSQHKEAMIQQVESGALQPAAYLAAVAAAVRADGVRARALLAAHRKDAAAAVMARIAIMQKELRDAAAGGLGDATG